MIALFVDPGDYELEVVFQGRNATDCGHSVVITVYKLGKSTNVNIEIDEHALSGRPDVPRAYQIQLSR